MLFWEVLILIISVASAAFIFLGAIQPARKMFWAKLRTGATYAYLVIFKLRSDEQERDRKNKK